MTSYNLDPLAYNTLLLLRRWLPAQICLASPDLYQDMLYCTSGFTLIIGNFDQKQQAENLALSPYHEL
jgi:hypothetical protein